MKTNTNKKESIYKSVFTLEWHSKCLLRGLLSFSTGIAFQGIYQKVYQEPGMLDACVGAGHARRPVSLAGYQES
jgi:hypothetical protein